MQCVGHHMYESRAQIMVVLVSIFAVVIMLMSVVIATLVEHYGADQVHHQCHTGDHKGLLHEAIASTAEGRRRWNSSVDIVRHLDKAMQSIMSNAAKRRKVAADNRDELLARVEWRGEEPSTEAAIEAHEYRQEQHAKAIELCGDDWEVQLLVEGLLNNSMPEELVELFGSKTSYETVRRRMNRKIEKYRAQGDNR